MPDYRPPFATAQQQSLIPNLAPIRADMRYAVIKLYGGLFADNLRMPFEDDLPAVRDSELNETHCPCPMRVIR